MPIVYRKVFTEETEEELLNMPRREAILHLTDKQIAFCEYYVTSFNITQSAKKAGFGQKAMHTIGWKLRQNPDVNRYIAWLKVRACKQCLVEATDIIDMYARVGFANMLDFVDIEKGRIKLKSQEMMDGQLIQEVREGTNGIKLKLEPRLPALDKLERYLDVMPNDWRQKIAERQLQLAEQRLELEKLKSGFFELGNDTDDGFIEALKESAEEVWEGYDEAEAEDESDE